MKIRYDCHIHSALSPCAENDMTPVNIVGQAKLNGLDMIAVSDHNAIDNVPTAMKAGDAFGVTVVPAIEVQTAEDIHVLCLFETYENLEKFYKTLVFPEIKNKEEIFGEQLIMDEDDNVIGKRENLLLVSATVSSRHLPSAVKKYGGVAVAAHIDREANGMVQVLGMVEEGYEAIELSLSAKRDVVSHYVKKYKVLVNSDAHKAEDIGSSSEIELEDCSAKALLDYLTGK